MVIPCECERYLSTLRPGCTDPNAINYDPNVCYNDGSCTYPIYGCTDPTATNYDPAADTDDGSCTYGVAGCIDMNACNYDAAATADDGSCTYAVAGYDCTGACLSGEEVTLTLFDTYGDGGGSVTINGTTYILASGYSEDFVFCMDLSVCTDITYAATDSWSSENSWSLADNAGNVVASGGNASGIVGNTPGFDCAGNCLLDVVTLNLYDSYGDGWNGGLLTVNGVDYTVTAGAFASFDLCIDLSICTDIIYTAGSWSTENSWDITDASGAVIASGPNASGQIGVCPVYGCTDSTAMNYDATATDDDGSCISSCTVAPYCENFDAGVPADWSNNGWTLDALGTGSSGTGPSDDITGGGNYMYYETSGSVASPITLTSLCLDVSALATPTLSFYNHMLGATMGTLDVLVNGTSVWSQSGDQGDQWNLVQVDLSAYAGNTNITIDFVGTYGGGFTGDMAIDEVCVDEYLVIDGCTDPTALNYNANANNDDGSCNYCTLDNVTLTVSFFGIKYFIKLAIVPILNSLFSK